MAMDGREIMIGDYILVKGEIRRVEAITKRKIGYHLLEGELRLNYARLCEIFPICISCIEYIDGGLLINGCITVALKPLECTIDDFHHTIKIRNNFGENLILREWYFHHLQHILRALHIDFEVKC